MIRKIHCTHHRSLRFTLMTHNVENQAAEGDCGISHKRNTAEVGRLNLPC